MAVISGLNKLLEQLRLKVKEGDDVSVSIGFTAAYALHVHEDLMTPHKVGQAKFLEQPARELSNNGTLKEIILAAKKKGASLQNALLLAGLRVQREAQLLTPVDTGNLRASAFTRID